MHSQFDVLTLGDYFFDQIFHGLQKFPRLGCEVYSEGMTTVGGAMFITVAALRRLDVNVAWPAYFGSDSYSRYVHELCIEEGIDLSLVKHGDHPYRRVTTSMPLKDERAFVTFIDEEPPDLRDHWLYWLQHAHYRHLHLGGMMPIEELQPLLDIAHAKGATVSLDCQDTPLLEKPCDCRKSLSAVDVFLPNAREALIVAETDDLQVAITKLAKLCPLVIVKDGAKGAWVTHDGDVRLVPGVPVDRVVDTTGAGDCFNAGFLRGWIVEGAPLDVCALYGNICGGHSVTGVGGATHAPRLDVLHDAANTVQNQQN